MPEWFEMAFFPRRWRHRMLAEALERLEWHRRAIEEILARM